MHIYIFDITKSCFSLIDMFCPIYYIHQTLLILIFVYLLPLQNRMKNPKTPK